MNMKFRNQYFRMAPGTKQFADERAHTNNNLKTSTDKCRLYKKRVF